MKKNQIEGSQKCLLAEIYEWHNASPADLIKKAWHGALKIQGAHWQLGKKYGKYGNFFVKNMGGLWIFQQKYRRNMGKIRVHQTMANIEDKSESKFMHLNITMF